MDVIMPKMDGEVTSRRIKEIITRVKVIMRRVTGTLKLESIKSIVTATLAKHSLQNRC